MNEEAAREVIRKVVRGERPWSDLGDVGATVTMNEDGVAVDYSGLAVVVPEVTDLASGFAAHWDSVSELSSWASIMLGASSMIDLGALESRQNGEQLIEALWDATDDGHVSNATRQVVRSLLRLNT